MLAQVTAKNRAQPVQELLRKRLVQSVMVKQLGFTCRTALPFGEESVARELVNPDEDDGRDQKGGERDEDEPLSDVYECTAGHLTV
jgi:hypothetical protein